MEFNSTPHTDIKTVLFSGASLTQGFRLNRDVPKGLELEYTGTETGEADRVWESVLCHTHTLLIQDV